MMRHLILLLVVLAVGCSENFGEVPRVGVRVHARATPIGPVLGRAALQLAELPNALLMATDKGLYRIELSGAAPRWSGEHPGFITEAGDASPQFLQDVRASLGGKRIVHNVAVGIGERDHFLFVSEDGGRIYRAAVRPTLLTRGVDHVLASDGPIPFVAVQGVRVWGLAAGGSGWNEWTLPEAPLAIDALGEGPAGEVLLAVQTAVASCVWVRAGEQIVPGNLQSSLPLRAVALDGEGRACAVDDEALWRDGERWPLDEGESLLAARLQARADGTVRYALLSSAGLRSGTLGDALATAVPTPHAVAALRPALIGDAIWLSTPGGELLRYAAESWSEFPLEAPELWFSALGIDRRAGEQLLLGNRNNGRVYRQEAGGGWEDLRAYLLNSRAKYVMPDPRPDAALWLGSFGLYRYELPNGMPPYAWRQTTTGMRSYLLLGSEELMEMSAMAFDPLDPSQVWSGATEGNGPYRSLDGGNSWERQHLGLGAPGTITDEDGLPNCSQVRSFVFADGELWMATFRGGVFRWESGEWLQSNRGLPDAVGAPVDSCCFEPLERVVDLRDMVLAGDGALLASSGYGIYRDPQRDGNWEFSGAGLTNFDVFSLAVHPQRSDWILATARGSATSLDWLFVSTDDGRSWQAIDAGPVAVYATDAEWISGTDCAVILDGRGAWRLELEL